MRFLHTSDWHLGHRLYGFERIEEHRQFLTWLLEQVSCHNVDAILISGDIFDTASPSARSQSLCYEFLANLRSENPDVDVVMIAGNHDSPSRLEATKDILGALKMTIRGYGPQQWDNDDDLRRMVIPLYDREKKHCYAVCLAVPFLRLINMPPVREGENPVSEDRWISAVRHIYHETYRIARCDFPGDIPIIALGHLHSSGALLSELSERRVVTGYQSALPEDIFPEGLSYVALGHLHRAQARVAHIRYSGSPLPLSLPERHYCHEVTLVDLIGESLTFQSIPVPRSVGVFRIPDEGFLSMEDVKEALHDVVCDASWPEWKWPFLEIGVKTDDPPRIIREDLQKAVKDMGVRLVRVSSPPKVYETFRGQEGVQQSLDDIHVEDMFCELAKNELGSPPKKDLINIFREAVDAVESDDE